MEKAKKRNRIILISLLSTFALALAGCGIYLLVKNNTPDLGSYSFLSNIENQKENNLTKISSNALIYNIDIRDNKYIFDLNVIDTNKYLTDFEIPIDQVNSEILFDPNDIFPVTMDFYFEEVVENIFKKNLVLKNVSIKKITFEKENINGIISNLLSKINNKLSEEKKLTNIDIITGTINDDPYAYDGLNNQYIYRPWINSKVSFQSMKEDILNDLSAISNEAQKEEIDPYYSRRTFACKLLYEISQKINITNTNILEYYCKDGVVDETLKTDMEKYKDDIKYTLDDYIGALNIQSINPVSEDDKRPEIYPSSNISSLLVDLVASNRMYKKDTSEIDISNQIIYILNYLKWSNSISLRNVCTVNLFANYVNTDEYLNINEYKEKISNASSDLFFPASEKLLTLMDEDMYGSLLCLNSFESSDESKQLISALLSKYILLYYTNEKGFVIDDKYEIINNAKLLELLIENKELLYEN